MISSKGYKDQYSFFWAEVMGVLELYVHKGDGGWIDKAKAFQIQLKELNLRSDLGELQRAVQAFSYSIQSMWHWTASAFVGGSVADAASSMVGGGGSQLKAKIDELIIKYQPICNSYADFKKRHAEDEAALEEARVQMIQMYKKLDDQGFSSPSADLGAITVAKKPSPQ